MTVSWGMINKLSEAAPTFPETLLTLIEQMILL